MSYLVVPKFDNKSSAPDMFVRMAWLAGCCHLHRRYERKADHFLAFTSIACILICYRRLSK
ncbi:hypothetical protein H180DRAFT_02734 [Streptomyces sp. WMMB 322]|nr:hypothetical protein H180DRAFT_02734 [Streptomyces sp. WMMB 322]